MRARITRRGLQLAAGTLAIAAFASCDGVEPTRSIPLGPSIDRRLASDEVLTDTVRGSRTASIRYVATGEEALEIRFRPDGDSIALFRVGMAGDSTLLASPGRDTATVIIRQTMPSSGGTLHFGVRAAGSRMATYQFTVRGQNRRPESRPPQLSLDEVAVDRIDATNDADVYAIELGRAESIDLRARLLDVPSATAGAVTAVLRPVRANVPGAPVLVRTLQDGPDLAATASSRVALTAGSWQLVVGRPPFASPDDRVRYEVQVKRAFARLDSAPESRAATIAIGDVVTGEAIDVPGDADRFTFDGSPADSVVVRIAAATPGQRTRLGVWLWTPANDEGWGSRALPGADATALLPQALMATGRWSIVATSERGVDDSSEVVPYTLTLSRFSSGIEGTRGSFAVGDTLGTERLDYEGDVDGIDLLGAPGSEVAVQAWGEPDDPARGGFFELEVFEAGTTTRLGSTAFRYAGVVRAFRMPAGGRARVRVSESQCNLQPLCPPTRVLTGGYRLVATSVDRAPEGRAASVAMGELVAEQLHDPSDIDEYTFASTPGARVAVQFARGIDQLPGIITVRMTALDDATGAELGGLSSQGTLPLEQSYLLVDVPASGALRFRVAIDGASVGSASYQLRVANPP